MGYIIAFDPCQSCEREDMCHMCELAMRRSGSIPSNKWISVEERLPETNRDCLLLLDTKEIVIGYCRRDLNAFVEGGIVLVKDVTHWTPLPEAPKGGE